MARGAAARSAARACSALPVGRQIDTARATISREDAAAPRERRGEGLSDD